MDLDLSDVAETIVEGTETSVFIGQMASDDVDVGDTAAWRVVFPESEGSFGLDSDQGSSSEFDVEGEGDILYGLYGTFEITADGSWTYTLTESLEGLNVPLEEGGASAQDVFTVEVSDGNGGTDTAEVTINLVGSNDGPVFVSSSSIVQRGIVEDATPNTVNGQVVAVDVDGPAPTWSAPDGTGTIQGTYGALSITAAGAWIYTLDDALSDSLGPTDAVQDTFSLVATDSSGAEITQTVTIDIQGTNDRPELTSSLFQEFGSVTEDAEDNTASGQLEADDPEGDTVFWSIQGSVEGTYGTLEVDATGLWTYTLDNLQADELTDGPGGGATESFVITYSDVENDPTPQTVNIAITIDGNDDAPIIEGELVFEDEATGTASDGVLMARDPEGDAVSFVGLSGGLPVTPGTQFATANGVVTIEAEGKFSYEPNAGFVGFDTFDFRAMDASGNFTDATATVAVESGDGTGEEDGPVAVAISPAPTVDAPAGSLFIDVQEVSAQQVNVVFALDGSGSVSNTFWNDMITQIDAALDTLQATFGSSETDVNIGFTVFSGAATSVVSYDLNLPNGPDGGTARDGWAEELTALRSEQPGGLTNWTAGLKQSNTFFDAQDPNASNFLFFITDGVPTVDASQWQAARDEVENATYGPDGLDLDARIEAFGIGPAFSSTGTSTPSQFALDSLNALDSDRLPDTSGGTAGPAPYFTALTSPTLLSDALTANPVFNPALVSLTVTLDVLEDGALATQIADDGTRALESTELDYVLAFAEIEGIADQLGVSNRFTISAEYDLDGDGIADLNLFSTEVLGRSDTAVNIPDTGEYPAALLTGSDLLFGSDLDDDISSGDGNDLIITYDGNDTVLAGRGIDTVLAGDGDDLIFVEDLPTTWPAEEGGDGELMDGGSGQDTLIFEFSNDLFTNVLDDLTIRDIETLSMSNGVENTMRLTLADVVDLSSDANQLLVDNPDVTVEGASAMILGDTSDTLFLDDDADGTWIDSGIDISFGTGETASIWQYNGTGGILATIGVDDDILVNPAIA